MELGFFQLLDAGGNVALVALAWAILRHEIRLARNELRLDHLEKPNAG